MDFLAMPTHYQQLLAYAFYKKDKRTIININREWRLYLKERFDVALKG